MKLLIVLGVIALVLWIVRGTRHAAREVPQRKGPPAVEEMVRCARCGLHLPKAEALPGRGGLFCGPQHRAEHEREHPPA